MTIRSKQWYTKTSRLLNSFAKNSIGRLRILLQQQDDRSKRPVESKSLSWRKGRKGFQRERNRRLRSLWAAARESRWHRRRDRCALLEELFPASGVALAFQPPNDASPATHQATHPPDRTELHLFI